MSTDHLPPLGPEDLALSPFVLNRLLSLMNRRQLEAVLSWPNLPSTIRVLAEQHLRWVRAAERAEEEAGRE